MESIYRFSEIEMLAFGLTFLRIVAFFVAMPVIGANAVPVQVKVLLSLAVTVVVFPVLNWRGFEVGLSETAAVFLAAREVIVGLIFGFLIRLFFMALGMAGDIISISLGISSAQLFNPAYNENSTAFDQFFAILATLFFFAIDGHHLFVRGLVESFEIIPFTKVGISFVGLQNMGDFVHAATAVAIKFAAPVMVTVIFTNVAMGIIGRAVPQINILITSLPINTLIGLFALFLSLPLMIWMMNDLLRQTADQVFAVLKSL